MPVENFPALSSKIEIFGTNAALKHADTLSQSDKSSGDDFPKNVTVVSNQASNDKIPFEFW